MQELMDVTVVSKTYNKPQNKNINRDNFLDTIDLMFENSDVIVIDGVIGIGKTTLMQQFCEINNNSSVLLFLNNTSKYGYNPEYIRMELSSQLYWLLNDKILSDIDNIDDSFLYKQTFKLSQFVRNKGKKVYFVIDGLDEVANIDTYLFSLITEMIPWGFPGFRFLLTTNNADKDNFLIKMLYEKKIEYKTVTLTGFTKDETNKYFSEHDITEQQVEELRRIARGNPAYLASFKRSLIQGKNPEDLIEEIPEKSPDLFLPEWNQVDFNNELVVNLLGVLSHDNQQHTIEILSKILHTNEKELINLIEGLTFIEIKPDTKNVNFISESFKRFALKQLADKKEYVIDLIIDYLTGEEDDNSLLRLPAYLNENNKIQELLHLLTPETLSRIYNMSESIVTFKQITEMGMLASKELNRDSEFLRFGVQNSVIAQNEKTRIWASEIKALLSLNDYEGALALAQSNQLRIDRLQMLAIIARFKIEEGLSPDPEIMDQIKLLCENIDFEFVGKRAIEIAQDIIFFDTELAIKIIEKSSGAVDGENSLDWAFASLSLSFQNKNSENHNEVIQNLNSKIQDPNVKSLFYEFSLFIKDFSADQILKEVKKLNSTTNQLYILANWADNIKNFEGSDRVIEYALKLVVENADYAPNAGVYRKLATQMPNIQNLDTIKTLIELFNNQMSNIEKAGPTDDYILLQITLAKCELKYNTVVCVERLLNLYTYINDLNDLPSYTEGLSNLLSSIKSLLSNIENEEISNLYLMVESDFDEGINKQLNDLADHADSFKGVINTLSSSMPEKVLQIIEKMNTSTRRNASYLNFIESYTDIDINKMDVKLLLSTLNKISDSDDYDDALLKIIFVLFKNKENVDENNIGSYMKIFNRYQTISESELRTDAICMIFSILSLKNFNSNYLNDLLQQLENTWENIDIGWRKVDIGFNIVKKLSEVSFEKAKHFLHLTNTFRESLNFSDPETSWTIIANIRLALRAFNGVILNDIIQDKDNERLTRIIDLIPSSGEKAKLWSELALRYYLSDKSSDFKRIVLDKVKPNINLISDTDMRYRRHVINLVAPSLFLAHKTTGLEIINSLPTPLKDHTIFSICNFIFTKTLPSDPYDSASENGYDLTYEEIVDLCDLCNNIDNDTIIFTIIKKISVSLDKKSFSIRKITTQQRYEIVGRIESIINNKLPADNFILHDGYKIISLAQINIIKQSKFNEWEALINAAREIPNISDRIFVLIYIIGSIPSTKYKTKILELVEIVEEQIQYIPSLIERINKFEDLASNIRRLDVKLSKKFLQKAMEISIDHENDEEIYSLQKSIIDFAHRIDETFAESLVSLTDTDPARKIRRDLKNDLETLNLKMSMIENPREPIKKDIRHKEKYVEASWKLLAALNAERIGTVNITNIRNYIQLSSELPLSKSYPILSWIIENTNRHFNNSPKVKEIVRPMFESILLSAELSLSLSDRNKKIISKIKINNLPNRQSVLVKPGERQKGINFIKDWFISEAVDYLKICDPYFSPSDLEILQVLRVLKPDVKFEILTSSKQQKQLQLGNNLEEEYLNYWNLNISDQKPPETTIVVVGKVSSGDLPIHDRWIITKGSGLRIGTSFNSLGVTKESEISILNDYEVEQREIEVDDYLTYRKKESQGERLTYNMVPL